MSASLLGLCATASVTAAVSLTGRAIEADTVSPVTVADKYVKGEMLVIPQAQLDCGGTKAEAVAVVKTPSGKSLSGDQIVLGETGVYSLTYRAYQNGRLYTNSKDFRVTEKIFEVSGSAGRAEYGTHEYRSDLPGIVTSLNPGEKLSVNQAIDLRGLTREDDVLSLFFTPETLGVPDVGSFVVSFTDAYDSENVVTVKCKNVYSNGADWTWYYSYASAGATGQPLLGIEKRQRDGAVQVVYRGETYILHSNNEYGTPMRLSMGGNPEDGGVGDERFRLAWELEEKQIFCTPSGSGYNMLMDLDEPIFYKTNLWDGFTTGEVFIDIWGENYNAQTLNFVLDGAGDLDLTETERFDRDAPVIEVSCGDEIPFARIGSPYRIFEGNATDLYDGDVTVDKKVYFNYAGNKSLVDIRDDCFTPVRDGIYTIVYTATDKSGNIAVKTVDVEARADCELQVWAEDAERKLASLVTVPQPQLSNVSGEAEIVVRAICGGEEYAVEDYAFAPKRAGEYTLVYEIADYVSSLTVETKLTIDSGSEISFAEDPELPAYFITGKTYELKVPAAYDYTGNAVSPADVVVTVREDEGEETRVDGTYTVRARSEAEIVYAVAGTDISKTYRVKAVDVEEDGALKMERYFVGPYRAESGDDSILFTPEGEGKLDFINILQTYKFTVSFSFPKFAAKAFNVYMSSGADTIKISYVVENGTTVLYLNGKKTAITLGNVLQSGAHIALSYTDEGRLLSPVEGTEIVIDETLDGRPFAGFDRHRAYLSFEIEGTSGETAMKLTEINNQTFTALPRDRIAPQVLGSVIRGNVAPGTEVVIRPAVVADVLDPNVEIRMSVLAPDGTPAVSVDGVSLADCSVDETYVICPDQYGKYLIQYYAADSSGQISKPVYGFTVTDFTPPEIKLGKYSESVKQGDTVRIASASAFDEVDGEVQVFVTVKVPSGLVYYVENAMLKLTEKGKYVISYLAYDAAGNVAYRSYEITAK